MYCKKCGTKQTGDFKYCPKCGTPFLDESQKLSPEMTANERGWAIYSIGKAGEQVTEERIRYYVQRQREEAIHPTAQGNSFGNNSQIQSPIPNGVNDNPYQMHSDTNSQSIKERIESKAEELSIKGKRFIDEKVRPRFDEKVEDLKNVNWDEKKDKASSFLNDFKNNPSKIGLLTKAVVCFFIVWFFTKMGFSVSIIWYVVIAALVYVAFKGIPQVEVDALKKQYLSLGVCVLLMIITGIGSSKNISNIGFFLGKTPQEEFLESFDTPSMAYTVRIDMALSTVTTMAGVGALSWVEVPIGEGSKSDSYNWTLIFFPENETKTSGRATLEAWLIDSKSWADALTRTYRYEIRDGRIELYNGYKKPDISKGWRKVDDIRLIIEKGADGIILKGEFKEKERIFKQSNYIASDQRAQHYYVH